jgi:hypothetical protein
MLSGISDEARMRVAGVAVRAVAVRAVAVRADRQTFASSTRWLAKRRLVNWA